MKAKLYVIILCLFTSSAVLAQDLRVLDSNEYDQLKKANQLPEKFMMKKTEGAQTVLLPRVQPPVSSIQSNTIAIVCFPWMQRIVWFPLRMERRQTTAMTMAVHL